MRYYLVRAQALIDEVSSDIREYDELSVPTVTYLILHGWITRCTGSGCTHCMIEPGRVRPLTSEEVVYHPVWPHTYAQVFDQLAKFRTYP